MVVTPARRLTPANYPRQRSTSGRNDTRGWLRHSAHSRLIFVTERSTRLVYLADHVACQFRRLTAGAICRYHIQNMKLAAYAIPLLGAKKLTLFELSN